MTIRTLLASIAISGMASAALAQEIIVDGSADAESGTELFGVTAGSSFGIGGAGSLGTSGVASLVSTESTSDTTSTVSTTSE